MALIICPEPDCGWNVSTRAAACPQCGCPLQAQESAGGAKPDFTVPEVLFKGFARLRTNGSQFQNVAVTVLGPLEKGTLVVRGPADLQSCSFQLTSELLAYTEISGVASVVTEILLSGVGYEYHLSLDQQQRKKLFRILEDIKALQQ